MSHFLVVERGAKFPHLPKERKFDTAEKALAAVTPATVKITEVYPNGTAELSTMQLKQMVDQKAAWAKEEKERKRRSIENRRVILDTPKDRKKKAVKKVTKKATAKKRRK